MNSKFSLRLKKEKAMPTSIVVEGVAFSINADFRNVIKILELVQDAEVPSVVKFALVAEWFFVDEAPVGYWQVFFDFINNDAVIDDEEKEDPQFDLDFDADVIYTSFLEQYQIDLLEVDFMHWYKFKMLLAGLSEKTSFGKRIAMRFKNLKGFTGKELLDLQKAKEAVQLPKKLTLKELQEAQAFEDEWGSIGV